MPDVALRPVLALVITLALCRTAQAADQTWNNGAGTFLWNTANNWTGNGVPTGADAATFTNTGAGTIDLGTGGAFKTMIFNGSGAFTIGANGSQTLTNSSGTTAGTIQMDSTVGNNQIINAAITLGSSAVAATYNLVNNASAYTLTLNGNIAGNTGGTAGSKTLAVNANTGTITINGNISNGGASSVALTKSGAGNLTLAGANTYTGGTTVEDGTLKLSGSGTPGAVGSSVAVSTNGLLDLNGTSQNIRFTAGTGTGTVANNSGSGTSTLTLAGTASINGGLVIIKDYTTTPGGKVAVTITNNTQLMNTSNTYSGGTTVNAGAYLIFNNGSGLGAGSGLITLAATTSGLLANGSYTISNDITGAGYVNNNVNAAATITLTGNLTNTGNYTFRNAGNIYDFAGNGTTSVLSGVIGGSGGPNANVTGGSIIKSGTGTLTLSGANIYTGTTTISNGTLKVSGGSAIVNAGLVSLADVAGATFQVVGSETIGALTGGGTTGGAVSIDAAQGLTLSSGTQIYAGTVSGLGSLTNAGANQTLNGVLSHSGGVSVTSGTLTLGNSNTYTGPTLIGTGTSRGIIVTTNGALGATGSGNETTIAGTIGGSGGSWLKFSGGVNYTATEKIIGYGWGDGRGFIQGTTGSNIFAGAIELSANGNTRIGTQDGAQLTLTGAITQGTGITTADILFRVGDNAGDFVTLANANNSFGGDSTVFSGLAGPGYAGLRIGVDNAHPTNLTVMNFTSGGGAAIALDLNGKKQTLNGLTNNGTSTLNIINLDTVNASTLTLYPTVNKTATFRTPILGGGGLGVIHVVKDGAFTQTLSGTNTYSGNTVISAGTLSLGATGAITNSASIVVASNAVFDVSARTVPFRLALALSSQTLSNSAPGAIINGTNNCSAGILSLVYDGVNPCFTQTNGGMTLSASTTFQVNNTGAALTVGSYKLIAKATSGTVGLVAGSVPAVTLGGNGKASGTGTPVLRIDANNELYLDVPPAAPTATSPQTFCGGGTVANLVATGSGIQWYAASTGGTALSGGTALVNNTTYYASQTVNGLESSRTAVSVTVASLPTASALSLTNNAGVAYYLLFTNLTQNAAGVGVSSISPTNSAGQNLIIDSNYTMVYIPATTNSGLTFGYSLTNTSGCSASSTVTVSIVSSYGAPAATISNLGGTNLAMVFFGLPSTGYTIQRGTNVNFTGNVDNYSVNTDTNGVIQFTNNPSGTESYYRLRYP